MFSYTYEMNLEYFAYENDLELSEDDTGLLFIYVDKENKSKQELLDIINNSGYNFEIEEFTSFYKVY